MDSVRLNRLLNVSEEFFVDVVDEGSTAMDEDLKKHKYETLHATCLTDKSI